MILCEFITELLYLSFITELSLRHLASPWFHRSALKHSLHGHNKCKGSNTDDFIYDFKRQKLPSVANKSKEDQMFNSLNIIYSVGSPLASIAQKQKSSAGVIAQKSFICVRKLTKTSITQPQGIQNLLHREAEYYRSNATHCQIGHWSMGAYLDIPLYTPLYITTTYYKAGFDKWEIVN